MPFDAGYYPAAAQSTRHTGPAALIDEATDPDPAWAAGNPDRMLAFLFVAPRDCEAVDAVYAA